MLILFILIFVAGYMTGNYYGKKQGMKEGVTRTLILWKASHPKSLNAAMKEMKEGMEG